MLYSVLSKCCVGNYRKCRILRYVVSLPRPSKAEALPMNVTESHFYAAFPELLDYFFPLCIWPSHDAVLGLGRQQWVFRPACLRWALTGRGSDVWQTVTLSWLAHRWCRPFMFVHCVAVRPNSLSLRLFSFQWRMGRSTTVHESLTTFCLQSKVSCGIANPRTLIMFTSQVVLTVTSC